MVMLVLCNKWKNVFEEDRGELKYLPGVATCVILIAVTPVKECTRERMQKETLHSVVTLNYVVMTLKPGHKYT